MSIVQQKRQICYDYSMDQQNQPQPTQGALQSLQNEEEQLVQQNELKRKSLLAQFENTPAQSQQQAVAGATQQAGQSTQPTAADYVGMFQKFAEQQTYGKTGIFPSAEAAYEAYSKAGQTIDAQEAKPGDLIYFKPDNTNQYAGHVGILKGGGQMESATYSGVKTSNIASWIKATGQQIAGIVKP